MTSQPLVLKSSGDLFKGTKGHQCSIISNTFKLRLPDKEYYHYDREYRCLQIDIWADNVCTAVCIRKWDKRKETEGEQLKNPSRTVAVIERLQSVTAPQEFNPRGVYDGAVNFFTLKNMSQSKTFEVSMSDGKFVDFTVTMNLVGKINPNRDIARFRQNQGGNMEHVVNLVQVYMRHEMKYYCPPTSKFYYKSGESSNLRHGLELWPAIFQSVRLGRDDLYLNIDTGVGVFYGQDLAQVCHKFLRASAFRLQDLILEPPEESRASPSTREKMKREWEALLRFIKGLEVSVNFKTSRKYPRRKIVDIYPRAGRYQFVLERADKKEKRVVTVEEYYQMAYGQRMQCPDAIGVVTRKDPFSVIPIEFCRLSQQMYKKVLDPENTSMVLQKATVRPRDRFRAIEAARAECAGSLPRSGLNAEISTRAMQIPARKLQIPGIAFGEAKKESTNNGQWNMRDKKYYQPGYISEWAVINFTNENNLGPMIKGLTECCQSRGMFRQRGIGPPAETGRLHLPRILPGNPLHVERVLQEVEAGAKRDCDSWAGNRYKDPSMKLKALHDMSNHFLVVAFLPFHAAEIRQKIKHWGDTKGFMTQCIRQKDPSSPRNKFNDQYYNNLALKINAKVGGVNFCPIEPSFDQCKSAPMMIVGADVGHASPGVHRPSLASVVFSTDNTFSRYQALASLQQGRMEAIADLKQMMLDAFKKFHGTNGCIPERIVFFRDGVSEGEFSRVRDSEVEAIHDAIREVGRKVKLTKPPKLTFIIVGKRHHLKFFVQGRDSVDQPPQGLVVDTEVISPLYPNFYLQSHAGMLGTRKSSHYTVLHNENETFDADFIQGLAFSLCHLQARATKGVSIPAPVAYADLVCSRVEFHFSKQDLEMLDSREVVEIAQWEEKFRPAKQGMYFV
ncbi:Piwi domain-containing protein [Thelephora terrestris]|uniref:Piwi domain-containing protein n=1 Tax=Thelephora terrestris TaxID=56493 RepID=A0A9P6H7S0_9AGAM|nr:Piwi domain-containing protein [Thelephora terrestris]